MANEFWEVICKEEPVESIMPLIFEDKIVPLWDDIQDWASTIRLTEWYTAVHAACRLVLELTFR